MSPTPTISQDDIKAAEAALTAEAMENWEDPEWRAAQAAERKTQLQWGFEHESLLQYMTTVENANLGDRITIEEVYGVEVFWVSLGGQIDESTITEEVYEMRPDYVGFHVSMLEDELQMGYGRKSREMVDNSIQQMDASISSRLLRTYQAAIPGPTHPSFISHNGFDLDKLDDAIDEVAEASVAGSAQPVIIARQPMISALQKALKDSQLYLPQTNEDLVRRGLLANYRGVDIIRLRNYRDRFRRSYFPANELFVVDKSGSKVGFWGGLQSKEATEALGFRWHFLGRRRAGFAIWRPEAARRYVNTALAA